MTRKQWRLGSLMCMMIALVEASVVPLVSWRFYNKEQMGKKAVDIMATIPGSSHLHLQEANVIEDPLFRYNEREQQWVALTTWIYESSFVLGTDRQCELKFQEIDGAASIFVNGHHVANTSNSFIPYAFNITSLVRRGRNTVQVVFEPLLNYTRRKAHEYPYMLPATVNPNTWSEPTQRIFIRKAGSDFGWDWGPAFLSTGLTGNVVVQIQDEPCQLQIEEHHIDQTFPNATDFTVHIHAKVYLTGTCSDISYARFTFNGKTVETKAVQPGQSIVKFRFLMVNPELWWPNGYGNSHLYRYKFQMMQSPNAKIDIDVVEGKIGIREVKLITHPAARGGHSFYFQINRADIVAKGANYVPLDPFKLPSDLAQLKLRHLLSSMQSSNMNMVRVWGGGRYESKEFYETCDELGLMVWQEFMFACANYPRDLTFLGSIEKEVRYQLRRLKKFTSIVIWGGNNENEAMFDQFASGLFIPENTTFNRDVYVVDYTKIFVDTIQPIVNSIDPTRPFVDTSPSNGVLSQEPYVKRWQNTSLATEGDVHYYNVFADCMEWQHYPQANFISEFGFQSFPSLDSLLDATNGSDWNSIEAFNKFLAYRQRSPNGTQHVVYQTNLHFDLPIYNSNIDVETHAARWLHVIQLQQAMCYDMAISTWRRSGVKGILYWQLNDVWQGPSWSSIEYSGRWKPLHAVAKRSFAPLRVIVYLDGPLLHAAIIDDRLEALPISVNLTLHSLPQGKWIKNVAHFVATKSHDNIWSQKVSEVFQETSCTMSSCLLVATSESESAISHDYLFFTPFKNLQLLPGNCGLHTSFVSRNASHVEIQVVAEGQVALFVSLALQKNGRDIIGQWSDNSFHLLPGKESSRIIIFKKSFRDIPGDVTIHATCLQSTLDKITAFG